MTSPSMPCVESLRESICRSISELPPGCSAERVREVLDPLMQTWESLADDGRPPAGVDHEHDHDRGTPGGTTTPLIVACDRGNVRCLEYLQDRFVSARGDPVRWGRLETLLGRATGGSSGEDGGDDRNTAMHHAAAAGCGAAVAILQQIVLLEPPPSPPSGRTAGGSGKGGSCEVALLLGTARNSHDDTPLMMAVRSPRPIDFIATWARLALGGGGCGAETVRRALQARNQSMDTCLSLACSHGHVGLVRFLLHDLRVEAGVDEVVRCRGSLRRMERALQGSPELATRYCKQRDGVEECLKLLESDLAARADQAAEELLQDEGDGGGGKRNHHQGRNGSGHGDDAAGKEEAGDGSLRPDGAGRPKGKRKKKRLRQRKGAAAPQTSLAPSPTGSASKDGAGDKGGEEGDSGVVLTTLADGKVAVRVTGRDMVGDAVPLPQPTFEPLDAAALLRERFMNTSASAAVVDDAVLSALCLDVRCLLYTEHGMALNLSSAQLDAVQEILQNQLVCVEKARDIKQRMHASNREGWATT